MSKKAKPRSAPALSIEQQKAQAEKDFTLLKIHRAFDVIEDALNHKVYSTEGAEKTRSLLSCTRYQTLKTFIENYAETPTAGSVGI